MGKRTRGICSVPDCGLPHAAKSYCSIHYYRLRKTGHLHKTQIRWEGIPCRVDGCERRVLARELCSLHYGRQLRSGALGGPAPTRRPRQVGDRLINNYGYVMVYRPDHPAVSKARCIAEHRLVMEQVLGRFLTADENVHHLNGIRDDNRPENLELWNTSQPSGQRIPDKVAWAVELLERYAPELLASADVQLKLT